MATIIRRGTTPQEQALLDNAMAQGVKTPDIEEALVELAELFAEQDDAIVELAEIIEGGI